MKRGGKMERIQTERFTDRLYKNVEPIWSQNFHHSFVQGVGRGTLEKELFSFYLKQDYVYLIEYSKLFAIGAQKATSIEIMKQFSVLLHETLHFEMDVHRSYAKSFGISEEELEQTEPTPINLAYTNYMLNVAHNGTLAELVSCLLPCAWDYWEIGKKLYSNYHNELETNPYKNWIKAYSSDEFGALAKWLIQLMDELTFEKPERELTILENHFQTTSRFEFLFWEMLLNQEEWPLQVQNMV
jgi:thiaminase/transcriptional activator TenA